MKIIRRHGTSKTKAISVINNFADELTCKNFPFGVKVKEIKKQWDGNEMSFSLKAKKGLLSVKISGLIQVDEDNAILILQIPRIIKTLISEDKIKDIVNKQFDKLFP